MEVERKVKKIERREGKRRDLVREEDGGGRGGCWTREERVRGGGGTYATHMCVSSKLSTGS